jgi:hypothetical protein
MDSDVARCAPACRCLGKEGEVIMRPKARLVGFVTGLLTAGVLVGGVMPAVAVAPERGEQVMVLNEDLETGEVGPFGCPEISWFGTIELAGTTYGMALYPLPGRITGQDTILHYEEGWKVWTEPFTIEEEALVSCEPGDVVLSGVDSGTASFRTGKFRSNGTVDIAADPFAQWLGRRVHQDGIIGPIEYQSLPLFGFYGDLRLN